MAATQMNRSRILKKLEKPRPLKVTQHRHTTVDGRITTVEDIVLLIDNVALHLSNAQLFDRTLQGNVITMCNHLKLYAPQLEAIYKDQLDRAFVAIRNGSQDERLDVTTRVHLLELIELRAKQWRHTDAMDSYYVHKISHIDNQGEMMPQTPDTPTNLLTSPLMPMSSPTAAPVLSPGEVLKNSGKFTKPTRIPGKNYCKDEVVIRNSDSGKVNPGAKERLVQITGTSEDKINYAKDLIKDTIQRNASPVRLEQGGSDKGGIGGSSSSLNSSASDESNRLQHQQQANRFRSTLLHSFSTNDASIGEYKYTVTVDNQSLKITGANLDLVRTAKLVLDEYFSGDSEHFASGPDYFSFEEEPAYASTVSTPHTPLTPANVVNSLNSGRKLSGDSVATSESEETYKPRPTSQLDPVAAAESRELTYEFLLQCSAGPYARRAPADWARIVKDCPGIVRKVQTRDNNANCYPANVAITTNPFNQNYSYSVTNNCDNNLIVDKPMFFDDNRNNYNWFANANKVVLEAGQQYL